MLHLPGRHTAEAVRDALIERDEAILGAKVDLVPASDLKPAVRERAEHDLVAL